MQVSHRTSAVFDEPNLIGVAGLVPLLALAESAGLHEELVQRLTVPSPNPVAKAASVIAGMLAGADSIDDLDLLRHGGMRRVFAGIRAPSTLGTFLRAFTFGHVAQLDAVNTRLLGGLTATVPGLLAGADTLAYLDIDDTIRQVHGYRKQGAAYGYSGVNGLNAQLAVVSTPLAAPPEPGSRSPPGRMRRWPYPDAVFDAQLGGWVSSAQVAETGYTAFTSRGKAKQVTARLVVRRVKDLNQAAADEGQQQLFPTYRYHALFTNSTLNTVDADEAHRDHAIIEQVIAELKDGPLAHVPSVILSSRSGRRADLHVCVMDGVVDAAMGGCCSARSDDFGGSFPGRVAR